MTTTGQVILLHGILRSKTDMLPQALFLEKRGYKVLNILYPSRKQNIQDLAKFVDEKIKDWDEYNSAKPLHFVVHSMGGLITRSYIKQYQPKNLGHVVMLSPPNQGSDFANKLDDHPAFTKAYNWFFGPAAKQLRTDYKLDDGEITYPLGVIAGNQSINPLALWALPNASVGCHDGIVPVNRTMIDGMSDHITLHVNHTFMMMHPKVMEQVKFFLENGRFFRDREKELVVLLHVIDNP